MWFDSPKISTGIFTPSSQYNIHNLPPQKLECLCSVHLLSITVPVNDKLKVKDLISAFGECTITEQEISSTCVELSTLFYDSRDALKAASLLPKFTECKEYVVSPVDQELRAIKIALPQEITKEELWYEISKFGDIAWSNCDRVGGKYIVSYLLFDIRCNAQLTQRPLMLNGHCLQVSEMPVPHNLVCRFHTKGGSENNNNTLELGSPIMASSTVSLPSKPDRNGSIYSPPILPIESRKPSYLNILASPPNTESNESTPPLEDFPYKKTHRTTDMPGQLTPPLQECRTFTPAITPPAEKKCATSPCTPMTPATPATPGSCSNKSNKVDLNLIGSGAECRTTVMLRNIPNKVNLAALRRFLDETNKNTYDFLYLRMDFNNKCNVGYAFINFIHPDHIATLTKARRGKKWTQYNSVKIIDVSFANIQGRSALIEKFRDSPIMNMDPEYRPKLYHTSGKLAGQEEAFP